MSRNKCEIVILLAVLLVSSVLIAQEKTADATPPQPAPTESTQPLPTTTAAKPPAVSKDYKIGAGDLLAINIWKEPDLSRTVLVRPDGKLSLPLVGEISANDITVEELQTKLKDEYKNFVNSPEITVIVQEARSQRFNVVGQVQRPGSFVMTQPTTVLDAIALVGGFRDFAKTKKIYILRKKTDNTTARLLFDYNKVVKGENWEQNIQLESGDTIVVP